MCSYLCCIVPGITAMTWVSAVAACPTAVEVSSATNVSNVSGCPYCCCLPCCCVLPPVAGVLISSHKDFSLGRCFYIWLLISSHCSWKLYKLSINLFITNFSYQKFLFTYHINILFQFLLNFKTFRCFLEYYLIQMVNM
jgi:hypothetical protein